jgi:hypothetical protein
MRQQGDTDAQFLDLGRAFVDLAGNAAPMQIERQGKPANAAADDTNFPYLPFRYLPFRFVANGPGLSITPESHSSLNQIRNAPGK